MINFKKDVWFQADLSGDHFPHRTLVRRLSDESLEIALVEFSHPTSAAISAGEVVAFQDLEPTTDADRHRPDLRFGELTSQPD